MAEVLAGVTRLDNAVKKAKTREIERGSDSRKLAKLRLDYPDLADLVADILRGAEKLGPTLRGPHRARHTPRIYDPK